MVLEENMAVEGGGREEEAEYESDPEEAALSLAMRRREASDDEEGDGDEEERENGTRIDPRTEIDSDAESDGQGRVEVYGDEEESEIEEEEEELEEEEYEEEVEQEQEVEERGVEGGDSNVVGENRVAVVGEDDIGGDEQRSNAEEVAFEEKDQEGEEGGEKKENEPFAVPTAGAFYMHDDRFRENGGGRHRRTPGGRKLWESKDDRKWGHDKFEELNSQERHYDKEGRSSKGQYRGRGRGRGLDRRQARGGRPRAYDDRNSQNQPERNTQNQPERNTQNQPEKNTQRQPVRTVRGRGPRRYEPHTRNRETATQNKQPGKSYESTSNTSSGRLSTNTRISNVQSDPAPRKQIFASSLNSASPPFYPSGASSQDNPQTQKREISGGNTNKNLRPSTTSENKNSTSHSNPLPRGKNTAVDANNIYFDEAPQTFYGKFNNLQLQSSGPSPMGTTQSTQIKSKGRALSISEQPSYQPAASMSQVNRVHTQIPAVHQRPVQNSVQRSFRASSQQLGQHLNSASQASSPPKTSPTSSSDPGEIESPPGSSNSKTALVSKGKASVQGNGRGPFLYNGAQVMGASASMGSHGDPNFPGAPALLQVMQFGGQHTGSHGVPAIGMALPGYVAQPGFGNSEMTWVPVLAGAAGALGASYCPPYLAVDGGYYSRPAGQTSSSASSKETSASNPNNALKPPPQRSELVNDEFGQRQNKPRRYSEMNFGQ